MLCLVRCMLLAGLIASQARGQMADPRGDVSLMFR